MKTVTDTRRSVMNIAWSAMRTEPARAFADCLRGAWKWVKKSALAAAKFMARARRTGGQLNLSPRCCRSNGNLSPVRRRKPKPIRGLGHDRAPLGQGGRASFLVELAADGMALLAKVIMN